MLEGVWLYLLIAVGAGVAGFVQGLSGFAFGMVSMSIWAWGVEPKQAAVLAVFGALLGQVIAAVTTRRPLDKALLLPFVLGGLAGVPLGVWLLPRLDVGLFKLALGLLLVVWAPAMLFSERLPKLGRGARLGDALAGWCGGVMGGMAGLAGALPTLWVQLRGLPRESTRAVIQNFNLSMLAVSFAMHVATGGVHTGMLPQMGIVAVCVLVPVLLGARLYVGISDVAFRRVVLGLLTVSGVLLLAGAVPALWMRWG